MFLGCYLLVIVSRSLFLGCYFLVSLSRLLFLGYYSVHPRKRRVILSQLPHVLWASGCWHYERTLYSRRPLKGTGVSIYLSLWLARILSRRLSSLVVWKGKWLS